MTLLHLHTPHQPSLPEIPQPQHRLFPIIALVLPRGVTDHARTQPVHGEDPGGEDDGEADEGRKQVHDEQHAVVVGEVLVGVGRERGVDAAELEVEGGAEQTGELLAEGGALGADADGLGEGGDEEGYYCPEGVDGGEEDAGPGEEEEDLHGFLLLCRSSFVDVVLLVVVEFERSSDVGVALEGAVWAGP